VVVVVLLLHANKFKTAGRCVAVCCLQSVSKQRSSEGRGPWPGDERAAVANEPTLRYVEVYRLCAARYLCVSLRHNILPMHGFCMPGELNVCCTAIIIIDVCHSSVLV
jgi:hypothetical protein